VDLSIPWKKRSKVRNDVVAAEKILNDDHYGLEKGQRANHRIPWRCRRAARKCVARSSASSARPASARPHWASRSRAPRAVTSFACRLAACGTRRKSAVTGAPYRVDARKVIQGMKKAKTSNPLFPVGRDRQTRFRLARPNRRRALLEFWIRNRTAPSSINYLEVDYDLSDVMFVTTANSLRMPQPLMDRMEIIRIPGYTEDEKVEIAKRHLIPKQGRGTWP